jgi:hypothetical protein
LKESGTLSFAFMAIEVHGKISLKVFNNLFAMTSLQKLSRVATQSLTFHATANGQEGLHSWLKFPCHPLYSSSTASHTAVCTTLHPTMLAWPASNLQLSKHY